MLKDWLEDEEDPKNILLPRQDHTCEPFRREHTCGTTELYTLVRTLLWEYYRPSDILVVWVERKKMSVTYLKDYVPGTEIW